MLQLFLNLSIEEYNNGGYFPIWGTCLGYELLMQLVAVDYILSEKCNCKTYSTSLQFSDKAKFSRLFSRHTTEQFYALATTPITYNNHNLYVTEANFINNKRLRSFFNILATSKSIDEKMTFISAAEGKKYPVYAVQFHPEKNAYMFSPEGKIDHGKTSIEIMQEMSTFFVEECRKNKHSFDNVADEGKHSVYHGELVVSNSGSNFYFP